MMNLLKKYAVALLVMCGTTNLFGLELRSDFNVSGGYRHDDIRSPSRTFVLPIDGGILVHDKFKADDINLGIIGFNARFMMPEMDCCCEYPFLSNLYLDGYANWGWGSADRTSRRGFAIFPDGTEVFFNRHGKLKNVESTDYQIGLGYLVYNCDCIAVGIAGGYSYDSLDFKAHRRSSYFFDGGVKVKTRWSGGWIGAEVFYDWCNWLLNAGYEFHIVNHNVHVKREEFGLFGSGSGSFGRHRHRDHDGYGNVGYITGHYVLCDCWQLGLDFHFRDYFTRRHNDSRWISYSILADIGYSF